MLGAPLAGGGGGGGVLGAGAGAGDGIFAHLAAAAAAAAARGGGGGGGGGGRPVWREACAQAAARQTLAGARAPAEGVARVERLPSSTASDQLAGCVHEGRPFVLERPPSGLPPPLGLWADALYLRDRAGECLVRSSVASTSTSAGGAGTVGAQVVYDRTLDEPQPLARALGGELYACRVPLPQLPPLASDVAVAGVPGATARLGALLGAPFGGGGEREGKLRPLAYFGARGATTRTHWDAYENALLVVAGAKRVTLYPPGAAPALKPVPPEGLYAAAEPHEPCDGALEVIVRAGDTLYLPVGWWHSVSCVAEGVTASLHLWATPRAAKVRAAAASAAASARCTPLPQ